VADETDGHRARFALTAPALVRARERARIACTRHRSSQRRKTAEHAAIERETGFEERILDGVSDDFKNEGFTCMAERS